MIRIEFDLNEINQGEAHAVVQLLDRKFPGLLAGFGGKCPSVAANPSDAEGGTAGATAEPQPEAKRRGRPSKKDKAESENPMEAPSGPAAAAVTSPEPPSQPAAAGEAKVLSVDELRSGLQKFTVKHGMVKGKELLDSFGCARVTELAEKGAEVHAEFMAKCNA